MVGFQERLEAEDEIQRIIYGYSDAVDTGDLDRFGNYFRHGKVRVDGTDDVYDGTDGVLGMIRKYTRLYDGIPSTKHVTTNLLIEVDDGGSSATAKSYFTVLQARPELPLQIIIAGRYADTFERIDGSWYLTDRLEYCDLIGNLEEHIAGNPLAT